VPCRDLRVLPPAPMGRSLTPITATAPTGDDAKHGRPLFEAQGLQYWIDTGTVGSFTRRRDRMPRSHHCPERGRVQFVLGSGRQGVAYLVERDGFLFESRSPGIPRSDGGICPPAMSRTTPTSIGRSCLHACSVTRTKSSRSRHGEPLSAADLRGHAIGCERWPRARRAPHRRSHGRGRPGHDDCDPRSWSPRSGMPSASNAT